MNLEKYKEQLNKEREEILSQMKEAKTPPDFGNEPGPDDETDEAEEYFNQTSSLSLLRNKLSDIDSALIRIEKGEYGKCEQCGMEIEEDVLEISPHSRFCKDCNKSKIVSK
ncbi:MAG: TraR/DksA C4-type zinc finger protein [Candidatus Paceibacterota bacterium]|jgi:DnaK suppressor protein